MWNTSLLRPDLLLAPVTVLFGPQASLTILTTAGFAGSAWSLFWVLRLAGQRRRHCPGRRGLRFLPGAAARCDRPLQPAARDLAAADHRRGPAAGHRTAGAGARRDRPAAGRDRAHLAGDTAILRPLARVPVPVRDGIRLGLLITVQLFISEEVLLSTGLAGLLLVAGLVAGQPRAACRRLRPAMTGLAAAAGMTLLLAGWALRAQFLGPPPSMAAPSCRTTS